MKKIMFIVAIILTLAIFTSCQQKESVTLDPPFPTAESVNAMIESLGEITDVKSAAMVSRIIEDYQLLEESNQTKISDIQKVFDSIEKSLLFTISELTKLSFTKYLLNASFILFL